MTKQNDQDETSVPETLVEQISRALNLLDAIDPVGKQDHPSVERIAQALKTLEAVDAVNHKPPRGSMEPRPGARTRDAFEVRAHGSSATPSPINARPRTPTMEVLPSREEETDDVEVMPEPVRPRTQARAVARIVPPPAAEVTEEAPTQSWEDECKAKIERALMRESLNLAQLAKATGIPEGALTPVMKELRSRGKIYNVGLGENPTWTWRIGDETSTAVLEQVARKLWTERPMTVKEVAEATGARFSRVDGLRVKFMRANNDEIVALDGLGSRYGAVLWFLTKSAPKIKSMDPKVWETEEMKATRTMREAIASAKERREAAKKDKVVVARTKKGKS